MLGTRIECGKYLFEKVSSGSTNLSRPTLPDFRQPTCLSVVEFSIVPNQYYATFKNGFLVSPRSILDVSVGYPGDRSLSAYHRPFERRLLRLKLEDLTV